MRFSLDRRHARLAVAAIAAGVVGGVALVALAGASDGGAGAPAPTLKLISDSSSEGVPVPDAGAPAARRVRVFRLTNTWAEPLSVVIEPWGDEGRVPPGASATVRLNGPPDTDLEVVVAAEGVTLYASAGSLLTVTDAAGQRIADGTIPFPDVPPGMTTREFMELLGLPKARRS